MIDPVSGHPFGSVPYHKFYKSIESSAEDIPPWAHFTLLAFFLVSFGWGIAYLVVPLLKPVVPTLLSYIGAVLVVVIGGTIIFLTDIRKYTWFAVLEFVAGLLVASASVPDLPEAGLLAEGSVFGGMVAVADGLWRLRKILKKVTERTQTS